MQLKHKKIDFSIYLLPEVKKGKYKLCTRNGKPVKLLTTENGCEEVPIIAVVGNRPLPYRQNGRLFKDKKHGYDLMLMEV